MSLFENESQYATGLVKPKTTSIFFEKIFIARDLMEVPNLGYHDIPEEVLLQPPRFDLRHELAHYIFDAGYYDKSVGVTSLSSSPSSYKYSINRNRRIFEVSEICRQTGINIVPIYFSLTDYERRFIKPYDNSQPQSPTISICINQIPEIVEERLEWKQVLDIRQDKNSLNKVRRFKNWLNADLVEKSDTEIKAILEQAVEEYSFALKKHGIETVAGAITTISSVGANLISALSGNSSFLPPGIAITSGITVFAIKAFINRAEAKRHPISIIYDLIKDNPQNR